MALSLVGTPQSSSDEKQHPFVHLDCYLGGARNLGRILLALSDRLVLFGRLYLIHFLGVCDFEPRNVLRKGGGAI